MPYEAGDIVITSPNVGHVLMCYEGGNNTRFFHAVHNGGCQVQDFLNPAPIFDEKTAKCFRLAAGLKSWAQMKPHADKLIGTSYGDLKAVGLAVGSSDFKKGDSDHIKKVEGKIMAGEKLKDSVTCVEAVVLCYQLTFLESDNQFIKKGAKSTMPHTLQKYLADSAHWKTV